MATALKIDNHSERDLKDDRDFIRAVEHPAWGSSLVINPFGSQKICSYDCIYCPFESSSIKLNQLKHFSFVTLREITDRLNSAIEMQNQFTLNLILSARGEASLHPQFDKIIQLFFDIKNTQIITGKTILKTNGIHLKKNSILNQIKKFDLVVFKLDAFDELSYKRINKPLGRSNLADIVSIARRTPNSVIEINLMQKNNQLRDSNQIDEWLELVGLIEPIEVHLVAKFDDGTHTDGKQDFIEHLDYIESKIKRRVKTEVRIFEKDPLIDNSF